MRCEVDRATLAEMLAGLVQVLPAKTTYPVLQNLFLEVTAGKLVLRGTDLDVYLYRELPLEGASEDGKMVVHGRKLNEMVRELDADRVAFRVRENSAQVEAGGAKFALAVVDPAEYPEPKQLPEGTAFEFPLPTLLGLHDNCAFAVSKDDARPAMTGINWEVSKTETRMVATDGHRLAFNARRDKFPTKFRAILPPKVFAVLPKGEGAMQVFSDPTHVGFKFADTTVICRVLEGPYPDYERVIPKGYPGKAVISREKLVAVLRRAAVLAHPLGRLATLEFRKKSLVVRAETPETGRSEEETECDYTGEDLRIGFNVSYTLEMLRRMTSDKVSFELSSPLSAGLLRPVGGDENTDQVFLLMPIRLD